MEEAQWFYEDFVRPLDPALPSLSLKAFAMRIFQHCPLMSEWSEYHHAAAFSEFLAYKTRVPVRGAIMLNESMDKVVLVKGWKKNANWSFPRGKINKEEKDLDCAVREVLEETGYDLKAAGLVKDEKYMKYIEITMREQHMKLYVFRDVPMDTVFAPQTRKEISRIEWVSLSDLPTVKKNKQAQHDVVNANKFYMVAPFLNPLKKWISQQRKLDAKNNAAVLSTAYTEGETSMDEGFVSGNHSFTPRQAHIQPTLATDLPKVIATQDVSSHLKRLLNIGTPITSPSAVTEATDSSKSNALLSLLRNGLNNATSPASHPFGKSTQTPVPSQSVPSLLDQVLYPKVFHTPQDIGNLPSLHAPFNAQNEDKQHFDRLFSSFARAPPQSSHILHPAHIPQGQPETLSLPQRDQKFNAPHQSVLAPYQTTQDPLFASQSNQSQSQGQIVPSASKLPPPKLTSHSLALLNVFKGNTSPQSQAISTVGTQPSTERKPFAPQNPLLVLLKSPTANAQTAPVVELAAQPVQAGPKQILQRPASLSKSTEPTTSNKFKNESDALTSATVSGPLRTPDFDKTPKRDRPSRAPAKQPNMPTVSSPVRILSRPSAHTPTADSPTLKNNPPTKNFQPQILRRSEKLDLGSILPARKTSTDELTPGIESIAITQRPSIPVEHKMLQPNYDRRPSQSAAQKETLLSLFGKSPATKKSLLANAMEQPVGGTLLSNYASSPSFSAVEEPTVPIGAISSIGSASDHSGPSQRSKAVDNKAFLLGFLHNVVEGKK